MKVTGPSRVDSASGAKKSVRAAGGFHVDMGEAVNASRPAVPTHSVPAVDALLALQTVPDATAKRRRAMRRGHDLLDRLNELRIGLLEGGVSASQIARLKDIAAADRDALEDAGLSGVLDEIDLRAKVELAKLGVYT